MTDSLTPPLPAPSPEQHRPSPFAVHHLRQLEITSADEALEEYLLGEGIAPVRFIEPLPSGDALFLVEGHEGELKAFTGSHDPRAADRAHREIGLASSEAIRGDSHLAVSRGSGMALINGVSVPLMVTDRFPDGTLERYINSQAYEWRTATRLVLDGLKGVADMHDKGLISDTISPGDLRINLKAGRAAVASFRNTIPALGRDAIAGHDPHRYFSDTLIDELEGASGESRTRTDPGHAAPEVAGGARPDTRSDVYEAAQTLYAAVEGNHDSGPISSQKWRFSNPNTSYELQFMIITALEEKPENRPQMRELIDGMSVLVS